MEIPDYVINSIGVMSIFGLKPRNSDIVGKYARHSEVINISVQDCSFTIPTAF